MGQAAISYPPLDVVIYLAKFLWIEDLHALTAVSHTINDMIEGENDLWPFLLNAALQRIISIPFTLDLNRTGKPQTKALIRRTCDHPTAIDSHILQKYKGPKNVSVVCSSSDVSSQMVMFEPVAGPHDEHPVALAHANRRTIVSNNCFPCLAATAKVPNALLPFTKVMVSPHRVGGMSRGNCTAHHRHIAALSSVAYFESTIQPTSISLETESLEQEAAYSIGLAASPFPIARKVPGEDLYSFGYDSKSGQVLTAHRACTAVGVPYGEGDTVGCGLVYPLTDDAPGQLFFTKNGTLQHKIPLIKDKMRVFFSIAWFPVVGVATTNSATVSFNFGLVDPFLFDVDSYELEVTRCIFSDQDSSLSDMYMHYINAVGPAREQTLNTKYLSPEYYSKKDSFSLFSLNQLLHQTLVIMEPEKYKNQGVAILSDDSSSDEDDS